MLKALAKIFAIIMLIMVIPVATVLTTTPALPQVTAQSQIPKAIGQVAHCYETGKLRTSFERNGWKRLAIGVNTIDQGDRSTWGVTEIWISPRIGNYPAVQQRLIVAFSMVNGATCIISQMNEFDLDDLDALFGEHKSL